MDTENQNKMIIDSLFAFGSIADGLTNETLVDEQNFKHLEIEIRKAVSQIRTKPLEAEQHLLDALYYTESLLRWIELDTIEIKDSTKDLLTDIISWEKDLSEYGSLEAILRERYVITKRI